METVFSWVRSILYFSIFATVLFQFLPGSAYKKYVQFFAGMLMILLVCRPILHLLGEEAALEQILADIFE